MHSAGLQYSNCSPEEYHSVFELLITIIRSLPQSKLVHRLYHSYLNSRRLAKLTAQQVYKIYIFMYNKMETRL